MTHNEARELIVKKIADAKALIESAKNGDALSVKTTLGYYDDKLNESDTYDERCETSLIGDVEIRLPSRDTDEDPFVSIGILCDLKRGEVSSQEALDSEIETFDEDIAKFVASLSNAESAEEFLTAESDKLNEESEKMIGELEEKLARLNKFMKIGTIAIIILAVAVFAAKLLF